MIVCYNASRCCPLVAAEDKDRNDDSLWEEVEMHVTGVTGIKMVEL